MPSSTPLTPIAFLPTHWTVHDLPLRGSTAVTPSCVWFPTFYVACLYAARHQQYSCVSHALNPASIFDSLVPYSYSSSPTFDESVAACSRVYNGDVLIGFVIQVGSFM